MKKISSVLIILSIAVCNLASADSFDPKNPPQGLFSDEWMEIYMGGKKIGYSHSTFTRENEIIHTSSMFKMLIGRVAQPVEINITQRTTENVDGTPITFNNQMIASMFNTSTKGVIKNGKVTIVQSQFGMEHTLTYDFPEGAVMTWGMLRERLLQGLKPGTQYTISTYTPDLRPDGAVDAITTIGKWEHFQHRGKQIRGIKVTDKMNTPAGSMEMISWVDQDGMPLKMKLPMPGMGDMEMIATDQKTALEDFIPPEMFMTTVIKANRELHPKSAKRIRYKIRPKKFTQKLADELKDMPVGGMQTITVKDDGSVIITLTRHEHSKHHNHPAKNKDIDTSEYLGSNLMMNTNDPQLIELAKRAAKKEKNPYALADTLRRFVTDYVKTKSLNIGFGSASEVCRTREGDCSEHGVLLAALGRIHGLPSRVAVGLAYVPIFGGESDIFGYHMWTQFFIDGRWVDFDAALRESNCSPTRIAFATSSLKSVGLADISLPLISKIGAIHIDILDVEEMDHPD